MQQILQNLSTGVTELAEIPCPRVGTGQLLIRTTQSLISAGTERMLVAFGKASLIQKARQQPKRVMLVGMPSVLCLSCRLRTLSPHPSHVSYNCPDALPRRALIASKTWGSLSRFSKISTTTALITSGS